MRLAKTIRCVMRIASDAWYGGYGPGWVSVVLSTLAVNYFFQPPLYLLAPSSADLPRLIAFVICAVVANAVSTRPEAGGERPSSCSGWARTGGEGANRGIAERI
jgi:hypothetical protein